MASHRKRCRRPLGHLTPEQLLAHRELEFLRVAARTPRGRSARRRHAYHLRQRANKLNAARQLATAPTRRVQSAGEYL